MLVASLDNPAVRAQPPKAPAITPAPQAPTLTTPANLGAKAGESVELTLTGTNLTDPVGVVLSCPGKVTIPTDNKNGTDAAKLRVKVEVPADCPIGLYTIRVATKNGVSNIRPFVVDELPVVAEVDDQPHEGRRAGGRAAGGRDRPDRHRGQRLLQGEGERGADGDVRGARAADRLAARPDHRAARRQDEARTGRRCTRTTRRGCSPTAG